VNFTDTNFPFAALVRVAPELHERLALKVMAWGESLNSLVANKSAKS